MTIFQDIQAGTIPARLTVDQLYEMTAAGIFAENEKLELIDGEIVPMAAAKANWHDQMMTKLVRALVRSVPDAYRVHVEASVTLDTGTLLEPDLAVWHVGGLTREVRGPDLLLVIEIADSSLGYDLRVKAPLYARYGVPEYWVVDAVRQTIRVHRVPGESGYGNVVEYEADEPVAALLPSVMVRLDQLD